VNLLERCCISSLAVPPISPHQIGGVSFSAPLLACEARLFAERLGHLHKLIHMQELLQFFR
jgi:hypothetical protein